MFHKIKRQLVALIFATAACFLFISTGNAQASIQTDFIDQMKAPIIKVSRENHLYASVMMAQAMLESDCGQSTLAIDGNNYFGVKGSYDGQSVTMGTQEMTSKGKTISTSAAFKKYPSIMDSVEDNAHILRNGTTDDPMLYSGTWTTNSLSASDAAMALSSTYATDMEYGNKLNHLIDNYHLDKLDTSPSSASINDKITAEVDRQLATSGTTTQSTNNAASKITNRKIVIASQRVFPNKTENTIVPKLLFPIEIATTK
ncbi:glucosaminidase domain-containing protein [Lentilactobacillus sp. SPB1-3]|uniref:Glucosaminidase domain-containing protein n=1 Tax=Lentilactobacillus terminaliae TaxID=3003483 RepID=A0ACD5DH22_9LACO|nr:glucosaminidase domain-containing protein [Lentilactobacillus sp. SPB1-3]MCZ0976995.1 glucosaminidase domain-containing protein [Lentilactobacillus sp. SPB1-3]